MKALMVSSEGRPLLETAAGVEPPDLEAGFAAGAGLLWAAAAATRQRNTITFLSICSFREFSATGRHLSSSAQRLLLSCARFPVRAARFRPRHQPACENTSKPRRRCPLFPHSKPRPRGR